MEELFGHVLVSSGELIVALRETQTDRKIADAIGLVGDGAPLARFCTLVNTAM